MKKHFATYDIALKLKDKGFNEDCLGVYIDKELTIGFPETTLNLITKYYDILEKEEYLLAPLWQQAIDWFRKKHNLEVIPANVKTLQAYHYYVYFNNQPINIEWFKCMPTSAFDTYEEARQKAIEHALTLI